MAAQYNYWISVNFACGALLLLPLITACGGLSLRGSPSSSSSPVSAADAKTKAPVSEEALAKDKAMLDMTALAYAQKMLVEVKDKIGDSTVLIGQHEFSDLSELYASLISDLEAIGDQRTIREQLEDLGLDPDEREERSDIEVDEVLTALETDIFMSTTMGLRGAALMQTPSNSNVLKPEELKNAQQNFGKAYEGFKEKIGEVIDYLQEKKDEYDGVTFSAGCFSLMWQGEVCRSRSLFSTFHAFGGDAVFGFCFINGSQQVAHPSASKSRCLITY